MNEKEKLEEIIIKYDIEINKLYKENKQLQQKANQLETNVDEAIEYIKKRELTKLSKSCYAVHEVSFRNILSILERGKE